MAYDYARESWIKTGLLILPSLAIVVGAVWALYTFVLKEGSKTHHIFPSVEVRALGPSESGAAGGKFRAYELGLTLNNASERDVYIVVGIVSAFGHTVKAVADENFDRHTFATKKPNVIPQLMMRQVTWSGQKEEFAELVTFPSFDVARGETAVQQYVLLAPSGKYDIIEIWMDFYVLEACPSTFWFGPCFDFYVEYNAAGSESCIRREPRLKFYYSTRGKDDWKPICEDDLRTRFHYKDFQTTRMITPPDAPILKTPK